MYWKIGGPISSFHMSFAMTCTVSIICWASDSAVSCALKQPRRVFSATTATAGQMEMFSIKLKFLQINFEVNLHSSDQRCISLIKSAFISLFSGRISRILSNFQQSNCSNNDEQQR